MNNLLTYLEYQDKVRLYESNRINEEYLVPKIKRKISTPFVNSVLKEEMELGKQVEERIKSTMEEINKICDTLKTKNTKGSKFKKSLEQIISDINKTSFDVFGLLGDSKIDFGGFKRGVIMSNVANIGVLLSPVRNTLMIRRAYKYFIGLIKQTLRRDLIMLLINFDQFQNMILQKSLETEENAKRAGDVERIFGKVETMYHSVLADAMGKKSKGFMEKLKRAMEIEKSKFDMLDRNNPMVDFFRNSYDNTYKQSADTLKQYVSDDNQKQLDAYKNSIQKLGHGDDRLSVYGELLISIAEEKSLKTSVAIHTNFLKISEVFKLSNQKKLVEMMQEAEKEYQKEIAHHEEERNNNEMIENDKKLFDFFSKEGGQIIKNVNNFDDYDKLSGEVKAPNDKTYTKKEILTRYLGTLKHVKDELKIIMPYDKYDKDYENGYLSYFDILTDKIYNMIDIDSKNDVYEISFGKLNDKGGEKKIKDKFLHRDKIKKEAKNVLKFISDNIKSFDYELLCEKLEGASKNNSVSVNQNALGKLGDAIEYMQKYKDNGYTEVKDMESKKESE